MANCFCVGKLPGCTCKARCRCDGCTCISKDRGFGATPEFEKYIKEIEKVARERKLPPNCS